jgi:FHA domain
LDIQLSFTDPNTGDRREPRLETPVAIGKEFDTMPSENNGNRVSRVVIQDGQIADYHALIYCQNQELTIVDQNTTTGIYINGVQVSNSKLQNGDRIQIGLCEILVNFLSQSNANWECDRMVGFLFKRRCGRTDTIGCPDCNVSYDYDYSYYEGFGNYRSGHWGSD